MNLFNIFHFPIKNINSISEKIAESVIALFNAGLNVTKFEIVGFSIGAQYSGYVARKIKSKSSGSYVVPRVVGFEPGKLSPVNLSPSDAAFVMTIHTGNIFSEPNVLGHVNFFPNGGLSQPMCRRKILFMSFDDTGCSHGQVQLFWIEAVKTKSSTVFPALKCNSAADFTNRVCDPNIPVGYMNTKTSNLLTGDYYLSTYNTSPFSKPTAAP